MAGRKDVVIKINAVENIRTAIKNTISGLQQVSDSAKKVGVSIKRNLTSAFKEAAVASAALTGALTYVLRTYSKQQEAEMALANAIRNTGASVDELLPKYKEIASSLQKITKFGDETILSMQAMLTQFGATAENIEGLSKITLDLATAMKMDLKNAAVLVGKVIAGEVSALTRYGIVIDKSLSKSEQVAEAIRQLNERFGGQAVTMAQTISGQVTQIMNVLGDRMEDLGKAILEGFGIDFSNLTKRIIAILSSPNFYQAIVSIFKGIKNIFVITFNALKPITQVFYQFFRLIAENKAVVAGLVLGFLAINSSAIKVAMAIGGIVVAGKLMGEALSLAIEKAARGLQWLYEKLAKLYKYVGFNDLAKGAEIAAKGLEGFANRQAKITEELSKKNQKMIDGLVFGYQKAKSEVSKILNEIKKIKATAPIEVKATTKLSTEEIQKMITTLPAMKIAAEETSKEAAKELAKVREELQRQIDKIKYDYSDELEKLRIKYQETMSIIEQAIQKGVITEEQAKDLRLKVQRDYFEKVKKINEAIAEKQREALQKQLKEREQIISSIKTEIETIKEKYMTEQELMRKNFQETIAKIDEAVNYDVLKFQEAQELKEQIRRDYFEKIKELNEQVIEKRQIEEWGKSFKQMAIDTSNTLKDSIAEAMRNVVTQAQSFKQAFQNVLKSLGNAIINEITNAFATAFVRSLGIQRAFQTMFSSIFSFIPFANGGIVKGGLQFATAQTGGVFDKPTLAAIAEKPGLTEAVVPLPDGKSIPVKMIDKQEASVYNINISAVDAASFMDLVARNPEAIVSVISDNIQRNGLTRKVVREYA